MPIGCVLLRGDGRTRAMKPKSRFGGAVLFIYRPSSCSSCLAKRRPLLWLVKVPTSTGFSCVTSKRRSRNEPSQELFARTEMASEDCVK